MKLFNKKILIAVAVLVLGGFVGAAFTSVRVQQLFGLQSVGSVACYTGSSPATTTASGAFSFLTRGAGTTTLSCLTQKTDTLAVDLIYAASSTQTRLRYRKECSNNNNDWYAETARLNELATSTNYSSHLTEKNIRFASTTEGTTGGTSQNVNWSGYGTTSAMFLNLDVDACKQDYTRLLFYLDMDFASAGEIATTSSTNGAIHAIGVVKEEVTR